MNWNLNPRYTIPLLAITASPFVHAQQVQPAKLELAKGNSIAWVGNTLGDRQQHYGWLESMIYRTHPDLDLTMRNLANAADELTVRIRSMDVPESDEWLTKAKADVIFAYFGFNESFKGEEGLPKFKKDLEGFIDHTLSRKYNGASAPRLVIFSPIAHEDLKSPNFPTGEANNKNIALYTAAMSEVAKAKGVQFVDLFSTSQAAYAASGDKRLTVNGIHLNEFGDEKLAAIQYKGLFGAESPAVTDPLLQKIREAVLDKNYEWHHRYRTVDQYNIYGQRGHIPYKEKSAPGEGVTNNTIMMQEMSQRDLLTANRDKRIHAVAKGGDLKVDDSNLPPVETVDPNKLDVTPYLDPEEAIKRMKVAPGCKVELVASEKTNPDLINPVQMNWDTKGRLWVASWPTYPEAVPGDRQGDHILVIDMDPKTGKAAKITKFASGLNCPTGFQFYKDGIILIQSPDLWYLKDTDGDGVADFKERILNGLDAADSHHETNSMCLEPGGAVYCSDGVFHRTNVETYNGPVRNQDGCIYRFEPLTGKFERYVPYGFANPHGRVFDYWGNDIITDATGNANYFGPAFSGHLDEGQHPGMQEFWQRPSRPCPGTNILTSSHFPDDWQGNFLNCNVISFLGIWRVKVDEQGSGLKGET
ncbi:MAG: dehydrogenase, partial [Verrucomicrobiaceae bacterium]